ncbi:hypothetical protein [Paenibacillus pinihumi]|uniref:hypothetical protein n=1 Tax=Paenibacillus pinihumi TaxID=669462 RepID=UPI0004158B95|nr:hypothetical protein [Paenibacillus pinihumi]
MYTEEIVAKWHTMKRHQRNAWVAEVVFGWSKDRVNDAIYAWENGVCGVESIPDYTSENFSDVLNAVPGELFIYRYEDSSEYVASFGQSDDEDFPECGETPFEVYHQGKSNSLADAVCLAAVIAKLREAVH